MRLGIFMMPVHPLHRNHTETLKEAVRPGMQTWEDYPILKFSEVPAVEVLLLNSELPSSGAGECATGPTGAAIANALYDALGVRVRDLPLTPDRIVKAMEQSG